MSQRAPPAPATILQEGWTESRAEPRLQGAKGELARSMEGHACPQHGLGSAGIENGGKPAAGMSDRRASRGCDGPHGSWARTTQSGALHSHALGRDGCPGAHAPAWWHRWKLRTDGITDAPGDPAVVTKGCSSSGIWQGLLHSCHRLVEYISSLTFGKGKPAGKQASARGTQGNPTLSRPYLRSRR